MDFPNPIYLTGIFSSNSHKHLINQRCPESLIWERVFWVLFCFFKIFIILFHILERISETEHFSPTKSMIGLALPHPMTRHVDSGVQNVSFIIPVWAAIFLPYFPCHHSASLECNSDLFQITSQDSWGDKSHQVIV